MITGGKIEKLSHIAKDIILGIYIFILPIVGLDIKK